MIRIALRGIAARQVRSALTALAVVVGVALISGTYILTDTIDKAFGSILTRSYDQTDAVVTGPDLHAFRSSAGMRGAGDVVSRRLLDRIRALPEVDEAVGTMIDFSGTADPATLVDPAGRPIESSGPTYALGIDPEAERFNPLELVEGRWAAGGNEVVIDAETAARTGYTVGDAIGVVTVGPPERFTIVGIARFGEVATVGGAAIALFDLETSQRLHRKDGFYTIAVAAKDAVPTATLLAAIRPLLPSGAQVRAGREQAAKDLEAETFVAQIRSLLLAFGAIALLVGAFVIVNTLSITVAQRTGELATLRLLGASARQLRRSVVFEGFVLGVVASVVGLGAGFIFAEGLSTAFAMLDLELPEAQTVFNARTAVVSVTAGIAVTTLAAIVPAYRATRVAPLAAIRESQTAAGDLPSRRRTRLALAFSALGGVAVAISMASPGVPVEQRLLVVVLGALALFAGAIAVAPRLVRPLVVLLAPLARGAGVTGVLARENAAANARRTAATAAALMVGLALTAFAAVVGSAALASREVSIREQLRADYIVQSGGWQTQPADVARAVSSAAGVSAATTISNIRGGAMLEDFGMVGVSGVDTNSITQLLQLAWQRGSDATLARLRSHGAVIDAALARSAGLELGSPLILRTRDGSTIRAVVAGTFSPPRLNSLVAQVVIPQRLFARSFPSTGPAVTLVRAADAGSVEQAVRGLPDASVLTPREFASEQSRELMSVLRLLYVLLTLAVLVGVLGMVNTLVLSVFERTREIGILRAVGMTRRQAHRMIRHEAIFTTLLGASLGLPLGIGAGAAVVTALDDHLAFSLPIGSLAALLAGTLVVGMAAAALPARQASRVDVLEALQYE